MLFAVSLGFVSLAHGAKADRLDWVREKSAPVTLDR